MKHLFRTLLLMSLLGSLTVQAATSIRYVHNDHLGTPKLMTDENQTVVWKANYDPFGKATVNEDPDGDGNTVTMNIRFPGQYYDEETGLHYNWHRYYDPTLGRYITSDPIGLLGGLNTYLYANGNPVNFIDPTGLLDVGVFAVIELDVAGIFGFSLTGGGFAGTAGVGEINSISSTAGVELGLDIEIGVFTGTQPPKNENAVELDIDAGVIGVVLGDTGDGGSLSFSFGPGTPGIVFNPGGGASLNTNSECK